MLRFQAVILDDLAQNLKTAKELGMTTILVQCPFAALRTLKEISGIDVSRMFKLLYLSATSISE